MTNRRKDVFDLFRENEHRLQQPPSTRAWSQLEHRLDGHRRRNRLSVLRTISMAAAVLLLAVVGVLIAIAVSKKPAALVNQSPLAAEELETSSSEASEEWQLAVKARQAEKVRRRQINEGQPDQKLIPANISTVPARQASLDQLQWLQGSWHTKNSAREAQWKIVGDHAMEGKLQMPGQSAGTETMRLFRESNTLYFTTDLGGESMQRFKLSAVQPQQMVFGNTGTGFPRQVILRRDSRDHYSITYTSGQPGVQQQRKTLVGKTITRQLYRMQLH